MSQCILKKLESGIKTRFSDVENNTYLVICTFLDPRFKLIPFINNDAAQKIKRMVVDNVAELIIASSENIESMVTETTNGSQENTTIPYGTHLMN